MLLAHKDGYGTETKGSLSTEKYGCVGGQRECSERLKRMSWPRAWSKQHVVALRYPLWSVGHLCRSMFPPSGYKEKRCFWEVEHSHARMRLTASGCATSCPACSVEGRELSGSPVISLQSLCVSCQYHPLSLLTITQLREGDINCS